MLIKLLIATLSVAAIAFHRLFGATHILVSLSGLSAALASLGLLALFLLVIHEFVDRRFGSPWSRKLLVGVGLGAVTGLIGGALYAFSVEGEEVVVAFVRALVFGVLVGAALHILLCSAFHAGQRQSIGRTPRESEALVFIGVAVLAMITTVVAADVSQFGRWLQPLTLGVINWVGSGTSETVGVAKDIENIPPHAIIAMVCMLAVLEILLIWQKARSNWRPLVLSLASLAAAAGMAWLVLYVAQAVWSEIGEPDPSNLKFVLAYVAIMTLFVAAIMWALRRFRLKSVAEVLSQVFPSRTELETILNLRLRKELPARTSQYASALALVERAEREGWGEALIIATRYAKPDDARLTGVAEISGLGVLPPTDADIRRVAQQLGLPLNASPGLQLQRIVRDEFGFQDLSDWSRRVDALARCICRIEAPQGRAVATGFLVGPDLVLTNFHVREDVDKLGVSWSDAVCRFDYRVLPDGRTVNEGTIFRFAQPHLQLESPYSPHEMGPPPAPDPSPEELDYALLRLAVPVGELPIGATDRDVAEPNAVRRGWISLTNTPGDLQAGEVVLLLQHPDGRPLQQEFGTILTVNANKTRAYHSANTLGGSSGSPCLSPRGRLAPLALHHAGISMAGLAGSQARAQNVAIPLFQIKQHMRSRLAEPQFKRIWEEQGS